MWIWYVLVVLLCLIIQGFFSGSETALVSCNKLKMRDLAKKGDSRARDIEHLLANPERFLATTLVGTNIALILGSVMATKLAFYFVGIQDLSSLIATIIMTPIVLMCSELIPKAVFLQKADTISLYIVKPIEVSLIILYPLVKVASFFTRFLVKILGGKERQREAFVNRYEIELLLKEGQKQGILRKEEHRMIEQVFTFGETEVQTVMVPLVQVVMMEGAKTVKDILPVFEEYRFSQIPIYEERVDNIIGVVYINDLLDVPEETLLKDAAEEVLITPENKSIEELLSEMRIENKNFAVAVDEYGGVSGILTVEDIIEEIVGDIPDEDEQVEDIIRKDEGYILTGRARIDDLEEKLLVNLPDGDYNTISGMITTFLGRIPNPGEKFSHENIRFEILESTDRFVEKVKIMIGKNKKKKL